MPSQFCLKVVTAQEMARVEKRALQGGCSEERFVEEAGRKVSCAVLEFLQRRDLPLRVAVLIGKGNKGADAYRAAACLLEEGVQVRAFPLFDAKECSPLNRAMEEKFRKNRGRIEPIFSPGDVSFEEESLIVDGMLGTGFKGKVSGCLAQAIEKANGSGKPILSIDIPSGLNGSTGEAGEFTIVAEETVALGFPKIGFFLKQGWNFVGALRVEDFGLPQPYIEEAKACAYLPDWKTLKLPKIVRTRHKYQAGYVVGVGGSADLSGAPKLSGLSALRAGAGIVRLFHLEEIGPAPFELICTRWNRILWDEELARAKAVFVGPGLGHSKEAAKWLKSHLKTIELPCVVDADALRPKFDYPENAILTPHRGEAVRLLGLKGSLEEEELFAKAARFCERKKVILILKGAPTFIFGIESVPVIVPRGDPGMATAGAGDVLTGILAGLLAQGLSPSQAAVTGVFLHALAGEEAAKEKTSYCLIASDLIDALPKAFRAVLHERN